MKFKGVFWNGSVWEVDLSDGFNSQFTLALGDEEFSRMVDEILDAWNVEHGPQVEEECNDHDCPCKYND